MAMNGTDLWDYEMKPLEEFVSGFTKTMVIVILAFITNCINGMLVYNFLCNHVFQSDPRYILYISLVMNDLFFVTVTVSLNVISQAHPYINVTICFVAITLGSGTFLNTPLILAGMAVERYIAVSKPLHHLQICTVKRTYILIFFINCFAFIPAIIDSLIVLAVQPLSSFNSLTRCFPFVIYNTKYHMQNAIATQSLYLSVVFITLFYTYFRVHFIAKTANSNQQSSLKKARNTILLHGGQLLLCMLSYFTAVSDWILVPFFPDQRINIITIMFLLTDIVPRLLSPLIYGVRDQKFLKHIKRNFSCKMISMKVTP